MRLLDRFRVRPPQMPPKARSILDVSGPHRIPVVGESHYQPALARIAGPKRAGGVHVAVRAMMIPEPENPYDANAVAIQIAGVGIVGYLSRDDARLYQPAIMVHAARGQTIACDAVVLGADASRNTQYCVWLHISEPGQ